MRDVLVWRGHGFAVKEVDRATAMFVQQVLGVAFQDEAGRWFVWDRDVPCVSSVWIEWQAAKRLSRTALGGVVDVPGCLIRST